MSIPTKKPTNLKPKAGAPALQVPDFFRNKLQVAPEVLADIKAKGQEHRWINYTEFQKDDNQHKWGWVPYKRPSELKSAEGFVFGNNPDGIIRRRELVLAVRPLAYGIEHRAMLQDRANRELGRKRGHAGELRQQAKDVGLSTTITEEDDDSSE